MLCTSVRPSWSTFCTNRKRSLAAGDTRKQQDARCKEQKELPSPVAQEQAAASWIRGSPGDRPPFTPKAASRSSPDDAQPASDDKDKALSSFRILSLTSKTTTIKDTGTHPRWEEPLRMSDLTRVRFMPLDAFLHHVRLTSLSESCACAVARDLLSNVVQSAAPQFLGHRIVIERGRKLMPKDMCTPEIGRSSQTRSVMLVWAAPTPPAQN